MSVHISLHPLTDLNPVSASVMAVASQLRAMAPDWKFVTLLSFVAALEKELSMMFVLAKLRISDSGKPSFETVRV